MTAQQTRPDEFADIRCRRCKLVAKTQSVGGYKLCAICRSKFAEWIGVSPFPPPRRKGSADAPRIRITNRWDQVKAFCEYYGYVTVLQLATHNKEPKRWSYWALRQFVRVGKLVKVGGGKYRLPKPEDEE
jgi:hypothetical protein